VNKDDPFGSPSFRVTKALKKSQPYGLESIEGETIDTDRYNRK